MRNWLKSIISVFAVLSMLAVTSSSYGVAAFARQTGLECNRCHAAAGFPSLNSFGAAFKAAGYTQGGGPLSSVEGENLNLPAALNLGVVFKARVKYSIPGNGTDPSFNLEIPDETAVFAAGRIGDHVGFVIELGEAWFNSFKMVFTQEAGPVRIGVVPWLTDAFGAGWIFETLSTGAVRNIRIIEDRSLVSAQSATKWGHGEEASGIGVYIWHPLGFVVFSPFIPHIIAETESMAYYSRVAVTPSLDFADIAVGAAYKFGHSLAAGIAEEFNWLAIDAQMMLADLPLTVIITYANDMVHKGAEVSYLTVAADYLILEGSMPLGATIAYRHNLSNDSVGVNNGGEAESQIGAAVKFGVTQNVRLSLDVHYGFTSGDFQILPMVSGSW